jgi:phenylalanyl-tRNA synthetase alpha chain
MSESVETPEALIARAEALASRAESDLAAAGTLDALAAVRAALVGKKGAVKALQRGISALPKGSRKDAGQAVNVIARRIQAAIDTRREELESGVGDAPLDPTFDPSWPGAVPAEGSLHPVTLVLEEIRRIFVRLGFDEVSGPEVEDAWHNFDALNIPDHHPAREPSDNFYVEGGRLLRSQTSTVQIRVMEGRQPPFRVFAPGRVYRPETVDATHLYAFHQVEGLMVGEDVTFADLKACLRTFAESMYGEGVQTRFRASYFPFTEVSAELDLRCPRCGTGDEVEEHALPGAVSCSTCGGEGWMEVLGCGMVHPRVLRAVDIDPERYTGFAFGMGVERVAMRRWQLDDIRLLVENDVRFLSQFR